MTLTTLGESGSVSNSGLTSRIVAAVGVFAQKAGLITSPSRDLKVGVFSPEKFLNDVVSQFTDLSSTDSAFLASYILEKKLLEDIHVLAKFGGSLEAALAFVARELARKGFKISDEAKAYFDKIDNTFSNDFLSGIGAQVN